jgi:hypothetical protein
MQVGSSVYYCFRSYDPEAPTQATAAALADKGGVRETGTGPVQTAAVSTSGAAGGGSAAAGGHAHPGATPPSGPHESHLHASLPAADAAALHGAMRAAADTGKGVATEFVPMPSAGPGAGQGQGQGQGQGGSYAGGDASQSQAAAAAGRHRAGQVMTVAGVEWSVVRCPAVRSG